MTSMTGFGRCMMDLPQGRLTAEVRTLNARGREIFVRVQSRLAVDENVLRAEIASHFRRGRIELSLSIVSVGESKTGTTDAVSFVEDLRERLSGRDILLQEALLARLVLALERSSDALVAVDPEKTLLAVRTACLAAVKARREEGASTVAAIRRILGQFGDRVQEIEAAWPGYRGAMMERLSKRLQEAGADPDSVFVREVAQLADRADIGEEISRLHGHLQRCAKLLEEDGPAGRELDFLGQELLRESNTIGSKCSENRITAAVIAMKSLSEQMRELAANLE